MTEQEEKAIQLLNNYLKRQEINVTLSKNTPWKEGFRLSVEAEQYDKILRRSERYDESIALGEACQTVEKYFRNKRNLELNSQKSPLQTMYDLHNNTSATLSSMTNNKQTISSTFNKTISLNENYTGLTQN